MAYTYKPYEESDSVKKAREELAAHTAGKPGAYESKWQQQLADTLAQIQNREKFTYDLNGDALFNQYKDQYVRQGQLAMQDTIGQTAALTGGYGNTYSQNAGQQAYHGYLQGLNDKVPQLYQMAYDMYNTEGQKMMDMYAMLGQQEAMDYDRYRDTVGDYEAARDYLTNIYNAERDYDYGKYADDRDFAYNQYRDDEAMAYQRERDAIADSQYWASLAARNSGGVGGNTTTPTEVPTETPYDGGWRGAMIDQDFEQALNIVRDQMIANNGDYNATLQYMDNRYKPYLNETQYLLMKEMLLGMLE